MPAILRWPAGLNPEACDNTFFHMCDWLPTLLSLAGVDAPSDLKLDGVDQSCTLRGDGTLYNPKRCWQWNRYDPRIEYNAAIRDGDWKLVHPFVKAAADVPDIQWLDVSMYQPEHFLENGLITDPAPEVDFPPPPAAELYNLKDDPLEQNNLVAAEPERARRLEADLTAWFEDVCSDLAQTSRE